MTVFVCVDAHTGTLNRYEAGGEAIRKTHSASLGKPVTFGRAIVEEFRRYPDPDFSLIQSPGGAVA